MPFECVTIPNAHVDSNSNEICCLAFADDNRTLASGGNDQCLRLWDCSGKSLGKINGHNVGVNCIAWLAGSQAILSGDHSHISLSDARQFKTMFRWSAHRGWLYGISPSQDGSWCMSIGLDRKLKYWSLASQECIFESEKFKKIPESLAWPINATTCAVATRSIIAIWDVQKHSELMLLKGHRNNVPTLVYSPDGRFLVSGSEDKTIRVWDLQNGREKTKIEGHQGWIRSIAFIGASNTLAAGDTTGVIRFWDIVSKQETFEPVFYDNREPGIRAVSASPDGKHLAAAGYGGTIKIWNLAANT